ncbi:amidase [Methylobacterium isbiliense]|jgi:Asp-tRNA(Asn)/Glu-tRNA(Gln) amidotransferase A subunit family amidase|uniref:Amidase AmiD n=1 Tax=Methylobacterium isbiliense TaxID=315478 RepID=A0ABQ4S5G7_9HYPH|nr:amidase [Methylobacterium isbiliense]MDN3623121.1 amidase [Methylobacterium isbiliense]GJD98191.1 Putative amidase AmiD [Methylobacterium isbiliense]
MLSLLDLRARIDAGTLTPHGAVGLAREAIAARDDAVRAFACLDPRPAVAQEGPLAGIAVGIKDIIDTADLPTGMGSPIYAGWRPKADAPVVARLRRLGAVPLAKTTTTPFAFLDPTATRNPRHSGHSPGGSSAGSAAAVGAGMLPLALGTQTGGSVIRPAAFCGVVGVKPSFRLLPTVGVKCYSWALDTLGLFAARVGDAARALALLAERPGIDLVADTGAPRIGVVVPDFCDEAEADALAALQRAARAAERAGARVHDLSLAPLFGEAFACHPVIQDYEARQALAWEYAHHREALPPLLRAALDAAQDVGTDAYDAARRTAHRARRSLKDVFGEGDVDVILTLSAPGAAPEGLASTGDSRFNRLWTLMGVPCVTVPVETTGGGLPLGVQVIARFGDDGRALAAARLIERAVG